MTITKNIIIIVLTLVFVGCLNKQNTELDKIDMSINQTSQINLNELSFQEILFNYSWLFGFYEGTARDKITFFPDGRYSVWNGYGLGDFAFGEYEILNETDVRLKFPVDFPHEKTSSADYILGNIFNNNEELLLKFDREYRDFYNLMKLYSDNVFFVSNIDSPKGEEYSIDNAIAVKINGRIKILNTLNTRKSPSIEAPFHYVPLSDRQSVNSNYLIDQYASINLVFAGEIFDYEAISKHKDEINGLNEPWYRIILQHEFYYTFAWVYGGYVEEISENDIKNSDYFQVQQAVAAELVERGFLDKRYFEEMER